MFKAILFDLDGTLVDTYPGILESLNFVLRSFHHDPVDLQTVKKMVGRGVENLIRRALGEENLGRGLELFRASYDQTHLYGSSLLPDVLETLESLHQHGIKMAVASNKPSNYSKNILQHLKLEHFFIDCYGPDRGVPPKPDPSMLRTLMMNMDVISADTLYVGDMTLDVETARQAKVRVVLIPTGGDSIQELQKAAPDYLLSRFSDLLSL